MEDALVGAVAWVGRVWVLLSALGYDVQLTIVL